MALQAWELRKNTEPVAGAPLELGQGQKPRFTPKALKADEAGRGLAIDDDSQLHGIQAAPAGDG